MAVTIEFARAEHVLAAVAGKIAPGANPDDQAGLNQIWYALLRHAAARVAPCTRSALLAAAATAVDGLVPGATDVRELLSNSLEELLVAGDLLQGNDSNLGRGVIYLSPPTYVRSSADTVYILGGSVERDSPLAVRPHGPYRRVEPAPSDEHLQHLGFAELPIDAWLEHPPESPPDEILAALDAKLEGARRAGSLDGVEIVDPTRPRGFYVGRLVPPARHTGRFIARRSRRWGGAAWSYLELDDGEAVRFVDLPQLDRRFRACDEAWRAICARDAADEDPQQLRVTRQGTRVTLAFSMPMPMWVERRMQVFGDVVPGPRGALFAYRLSAEDAERQVTFLHNTLWMASVEMGE